MKYTTVTDLRWAGQNQISMNVDFEGLGIVPFLATLDDVEDHGRDLYTRALAGDFGPIAPYAPPPEPPAPIPASVTRRQARLALLDAGMLDAVEGYIDSITNQDERRAAQIEYEADTWGRGNVFLQTAWAALGGTEQQLDDLFALAATK